MSIMQVDTTTSFSSGDISGVAAGGHERRSAPGGTSRQSQAQEARKTLRKQGGAR